MCEGGCIEMRLFEWFTLCGIFIQNRWYYAQRYDIYTVNILEPMSYTRPTSIMWNVSHLLLYIYLSEDFVLKTTSTIIDVLLFAILI